MRSIRRMVMIGGILMSVRAGCLAQEDPWSLVKTSGDTLHHCSLNYVRDSLISVVSKGVAARVQWDSVQTLILRRSAPTYTGATLGLLAGGAIAAFLGSATYKEPPPGDVAEAGAKSSRVMVWGFCGGIGGIVIGGIIGSSSGGDEVYDLSKIDMKSKADLVRRLIVYEPDQYIQH